MAMLRLHDYLKRPIRRSAWSLDIDGDRQRDTPLAYITPSRASMVRVLGFTSRSQGGRPGSGGGGGGGGERVWQPWCRPQPRQPSLSHDHLLHQDEQSCRRHPRSVSEHAPETRRAIPSHRSSRNTRFGGSVRIRSVPEHGASRGGRAMRAITDCKEKERTGVSCSVWKVPPPTFVSRPRAQFSA